MSQEISECCYEPSCSGYDSFKPSTMDSRSDGGGGMACDEHVGYDLVVEDEG